MVPYIVSGVIALVVLGVGAYYIARMMKGKLTLDLSRNAANSGEVLSGRLTMEAKRPIHGLLKVSLVGREKRRRRRAGSNNNTTEWVEVYRDDHILEETRDFQAGFMQSYDFQIVAPSAAEARSGGAVLRQAAEEVGSGMAGVLMKAAAGAVDMMAGRIDWHVESRLDAEGVDLFTKQRVHVNLRG